MGPILKMIDNTGAIMKIDVADGAKQCVKICMKGINVSMRLVPVNPHFLYRAKRLMALRTRGRSLQGFGKLGQGRRHAQIGEFRGCILPDQAGKNGMRCDENFDICKIRGIAMDSSRKREPCYVLFDGSYPAYVIRES